jgi:hypothetical protein
MKSKKQMECKGVGDSRHLPFVRFAIRSDQALAVVLR